MRVLAVDPGYDRLGVAVMEKQSGKEKLIYSACIETTRGDTLPRRLHELGVAFQKLLTTHHPDAVAVETLFFNKNQKTAIAVAEARGIVLYLAETAGCKISEYGPQEVKVAVTGHGGSDKKAVTDMLFRLIKGVPEKAHDDEYDAIALAITHLAHTPELAHTNTN